MFCTLICENKKISLDCDAGEEKILHAVSFASPMFLFPEETSSQSEHINVVQTTIIALHLYIEARIFVTVLNSLDELGNDFDATLIIL